jgi:hypothetical protein
MRANAAMAAVASIRVIELSARPTREPLINCSRHSDGLFFRARRCDIYKGNNHSLPIVYMARDALLSKK